MVIVSTPFLFWNNRTITELENQPNFFDKCLYHDVKLLLHHNKAYKQRKTPPSLVEFSVVALPIFTARGRDASAASGGASELSKRQRSKFRERIANWKFRAPQQEIYRPAVASVRWTLAGRKKPRLFSRGFLCLRYLFSRPVTRQLSSAYMCLTSVFGMGTGGPT